MLGRYAADRHGVRCVMHTVHGARFHDGQPRWRNGVIIAGERLAAKRCHRMLSVSAALRDRFIAAGIGRPSQYRVVYSGLELERYADAAAARVESRRVFGFGDDDFVIGTVGRLAPMKGHDDVLNALSDDLRRDPRVKLLWVGGGPERERLRAAVADRGLAAQVVMTGHQPSDRVPSLVAAMDAMAHPSYREGFPLAVLHAMLCGVPAIAYDVDGPGEMLVDNESGFLLRAGDKAGLCRTALALRADPERRRRVGCRARETATERYGHVRMVSDIEAHYEEVLHG